MDTPVITTPLSIASPRYPTLSMIDQVRGDLLPRFADDPCADHLEECARRLTAATWSDLVWITGAVPAACFQHVCEQLERERSLVAQRASLPQTGSAA